MFAYCGNNPINREDPSGCFWKQIGGFFRRVGNAISNFAQATFGAGATVVNQVAPPAIEYSPPVVNSFVTVKKGTKATTTGPKKGDSSKPISVYAQGRSDNWLLSSAGLKINVSSFTLNISLGFDDIGINGSVKKGDTTSSFGIKADISQFKIGFERSTTVKCKWDENTSNSEYTNASVTGWTIYAAYILVTDGQWVPSQQTVRE